MTTVLKMNGSQKKLPNNGVPQYEFLACRVESRAQGSRLKIGACVRVIHDDMSEQFRTSIG